MILILWIVLNSKQCVFDNLKESYFKVLQYFKYAREKDPENLNYYHNKGIYQNSSLKRQLQSLGHFLRDISIEQIRRASTIF
ncbi:unnamed protein product [Paramecium octaurelia]|uniref:Uncharacterized protein n=1 Tax=Paramecium octaurelia TaxID=43137 RepID=A0A8S1TDM1_PAROT|nr:unnamed protein product [Paramecium octaurelia]